MRHDLTRHGLALAPTVLALLLGGAMAPAMAQGEPCNLVFGQARNEATGGMPDWEALNERFNAEVTEALQAAGRRAVAMTVPALQISPEAAGLALLQRADELGCRTLVETTVFANEEQTLVLRLRVYPLLPQLDDSAVIVGLRIGSPLFVTQRELALAAWPRLKPELIARLMTQEYLQHDNR